MNCEAAASKRSYIRNKEDVKVMIKHAKLEENDLKPLTQAIYFSTKCEEYKLLELNSPLMNSLKEGQKVVFRGTREDKAVLCTADTTFDVKEAETSNSLLLLPGLKLAEECQPNSSEDSKPLEDKEIVGVFHTYLEVRQIKPRLKKLQIVLEPSSYRGSELEEQLRESGAQLFTTEGLLEVVQASEQELLVGLEQLGACCIEGYWRVFEFDYHFRVLSYFLNLIDSNSWNVTCIPYQETVENLQDLMPHYILEHVFHQYTEMSGERDDEGEPLYSLKEEKVCRFLAEALLRNAGRFNLQDFLQAWQDSVPEGLQTDLKQLDGMALVDLDVKPQVIWFYPESELPDDIQERINILFQVREKWTLEEIRPFVEKLTTEKQNVNALLTKYARSSNVAGVRYYGARHGK